MKTRKAISMLACIIAAFIIASPYSAGKKKYETPKYVFLFIGDGMGMSQVAAAESFMSYKADKLGGEQVLFTTFPVHGSAFSYSAD